MSLKSWVSDRMHRVSILALRPDLPPREMAPEFQPPPPPAPTHITEPVLANAEHLGPYGPLIRAIRDELENFIVSHVQLHLAIADRDRFVLTAIGVRCAGHDEARERLHRFMHEFKPEQVKRYLAREVIAGLPNAAAIELSQFAGLLEADAHDEAGDYSELLAALAGPRAAGEGPAYEVAILGRWSELDATPPRSVRNASSSAPVTPLAGQRCEFDVEDADGRRRVVLQAVVPGRRYVIGKGEGCDICVNGSYTSRRHAEIWMEQGVWWAGDAGSTNGVRVEALIGARGSGAGSSDGVQARSSSAAGVGDKPVRLGDGMRLVLSARSEGPAADYPWIGLRAAASPAARLTPIAVASPQTPLTAIRASVPAAAFTITAAQGGGTSTIELLPHALPVSVGRSRNQTLVIDRRHDGVSGHHMDIVDLDESGVHVLVHGDNGVVLDGVRHAAGARVRWLVGQRMVLGAAPHDDTVCTLVLGRGDEAR